MRFQDLPIKRKLVGVIFLTSLSVLSLTCLALLTYEIISYKQTTTRSLSTIAGIISANSTAVLVFDDPKVAQEILSGLRAESEVTAAALFDRNGKLYAAYPPDLAAASLPSSPTPDGIEFHAKYVTLSKPVVQGQKRVGTLFLQADLQEMYRRLSVYVLVLVLVLSSSGFLAFFLSSFFERQISKPLLALANTAKTVSEQKDYSVRGVKISSDELGYLTDSFNNMLERIQASDSALLQAKNELAKANEWLEKRVRERTVDLIQANTDLEAEIVARKQAEMVHAQLAAIVQSSSDAILSKTPEGIITSWNKGAEKMFGYTAEEIMGRAVSILIPVDRSDELGPFLDRIQREETVEPFETVRVRKDGRLVNVSLTLSPIKDEAGRITSVSAIMQDISERKRLEAEILQVSEYEQRRIAEDLHDGVGQQLGGISFLSDVLKKNLAEQASPEAEAAAKISKLLTVAMAQTRSLARGLHPVAPETNGLMSALEDLASRVTELFKASCHFECPQPVLIEDNTVATHLYRIAQEATTNAIKHGQARRIEIRLSSDPERITLAVRDDGVGLKAGVWQQKGMGLRIMNHRASMIGGTLSLQERRGGGTAVICTVSTNGDANSTD